MIWRKLGNIFNVSETQGKFSKGASMPVAEVVDASSGLVRVYFSPRDHLNRSEVRFFDFSIQEPHRIVSVSEKPLLAHGGLGSFDEFGTMLGSIVSNGPQRLVFYTGWSRTYGVPYNNSIGVAELAPDGSITRLGDGPVMTRTLREPFSCASPFVIYDGGMYKMWYASMDKWEATQDGPKHFYNIKYATSSDGLTWNRDCQVAIDYQFGGEYAFGRPFVKVEGEIYKMWYSFRGKNYRIGYAESRDGLDWKRMDGEAGIAPGDNGWDSQMVEYPHIFDLDDRRYMLYNGNEYGASGIGLAVLDG